MESTDLAALLARAPITRLLGHRLVAAGDGTASLGLAPRDDFVQEAGRVHGGILTTLLDTACVYALLSTERWPATFTSIEFKLNFLRPVALGGGEMLATADVVQQGRRVGVCAARLEQDGKQLATGLFTYLRTDA